jgi:ABC-type transport system involved in multi-copper enzyme maturation permease subunit
MISLAIATFRGILRDRVFHGIMLIAALFLFIPAVSNISMRQIAELSVSLSLSLVSFVLLLLSVFLGGTTLWRDVERRYTFSVLGLPLSRSSYLLGRYLGVAGALLAAAVVLGLGAMAAVKYGTAMYPPERPLRWLNILLALGFDALKYLLLVALAFLFSTVSTSFFLPIFGTVSFFWLGCVSQQVYDYVHSPLGEDMPRAAKSIVLGLYYLLPNFTPFDLKAYAVYSLDVSWQGILYTSGYFVIYLSLLLLFAVMLFRRREFQ